MSVKPWYSFFTNFTSGRISKMDVGRGIVFITNFICDRTSEIDVAVESPCVE